MRCVEDVCSLLFWMSVAFSFGCIVKSRHLFKALYPFLGYEVGFFLKRMGELTGDLEPTLL